MVRGCRSVARLGVVVVAATTSRCRIATGRGRGTVLTVLSLYRRLVVVPTRDVAVIAVGTTRRGLPLWRHGGGDISFCGSSAGNGGWSVTLRLHTVGCLCSGGRIQNCE